MNFFFAFSNVIVGFFLMTLELEMRGFHDLLFKVAGAITYELMHKISPFELGVKDD
jgi:hypothetical protein